MMSCFVAKIVYRQSLQSHRYGRLSSNFDTRLLRHEISSNCKLVSSKRCFTALSMNMLKELRTISGAPIVECKKALQSTSNDLNAAIDWLREHGSAKASAKVQGRETTEGLVAIQISSDGKSGSIVRISSETDFAGRSDKFVSFVADVASATSTVPSATAATGGGQQQLDSESVLSAQANGKSVKDLLDEVIVAIRENISIAEAIKLESSSDSSSIFVGYVHNKIQLNVNAGTAAAVVELVPIKGDVTTSIEVLNSIGKKLAMHVVAAKPLYNSISEVPEIDVQKETEVLTKQLTTDPANQSKPLSVIEKIVQGRLRKFYEMICLTEQGHMLEEKNPKIGDYMKSVGVEVKSFKLLSIN
jgi:elongation factor Ts